MSKECKPDKVVVLEEVKKIPVCITVTKQQCDSRWKVTEEGLMSGMGTRTVEMLDEKIVC